MEVCLTTELMLLRPSSSPCILSSFKVERSMSLCGLISELSGFPCPWWWGWLLPGCVVFCRVQRHSFNGHFTVALLKVVSRLLPPTPPLAWHLYWNSGLASLMCRNLPPSCNERFYRDSEEWERGGSFSEEVPGSSAGLHPLQLMPPLLFLRKFYLCESRFIQKMHQGLLFLFPERFLT